MRRDAPECRWKKLPFEKTAFIPLTSQGNTLIAVPVTWEPAPAFGSPTVTRGWWAQDIPYGRQYDILPDGNHLVLLSATGRAGNEITVVLNWFEELKQKVGARKNWERLAAGDWQLAAITRRGGVTQPDDARGRHTARRV